MIPSSLRIAVLLPCFNEAAAVATVVADFRKALPGATIYVYDNNSTDRTAELARAAGAEVRSERRQGKGHVVRRMFADVDADLYLLVDGDATYDAAAAPRLVDRLLEERLDMVVGRRVHQAGDAYRRGHVLGNRVLTWFLALLFGRRFTDILSGYRVFSRRFVKSFPALAQGFEIETELTVHALHLGLPVAEIDTIYLARPAGSASKLNTWRDGLRILRLMLTLFKNERPLAFFTIAAMLLALLAVVLALPVFETYFQTGLVPRFPTAILSASIMVLAFLAFVCGLVLDTVTRGRREVKRLAYLAEAAPGERVGRLAAADPATVSSPRPEAR